ncbi:hypothetical protein [Hyalangium rubrum]|uniref:Uncharacterized protein n=1 Tax=Hyalangium rubrum TaxID=3103134 RepID=A0ABU5H028_9BACT|nr:hypothetical protein [Hyalangium sp. s54d21]MDY7226138.1 hypothetical protein [Hyalangium sp. s54d21]
MTPRSFPPWLLVARLLGTVALIGALAVALQPGILPPWLGPVFLGVFLVLRVGSEWLMALRYPDPEGRHRRSAILNTLIAIGVVAFWFYLRKRGL